MSLLGQEFDAPVQGIAFSFDGENDLATVNEGIEKCTKQLGKYKEQLDSFFQNHQCYNDEMLVEALKVDKDKVPFLLQWYARLELGSKIQKCLEEQGYCDFTADL